MRSHFYFRHGSLSTISPGFFSVSFQLAFAVNFDAGRVYIQVEGYRQTLDRQGARQSPPP